MDIRLLSLTLMTLRRCSAENLTSSKYSCCSASMWVSKHSSAVATNGGDQVA